MKSMSVLRLALAAMAAMPGASACSQSVSDSPQQPVPAQTVDALVTHPESGLEVVALTVTSGRTAHAFRVEIARNRFEQARGLMFRRKMGADEGMLFPFDAPRRASFWMRNTVIPLDIVFIGGDGRILNIAARTVPYSEDAINSEGKAAAVLELVGGRAEQLGIRAGDKVSW